MNVLVEGVFIWKSKYYQKKASYSNRLNPKNSVEQFQILCVFLFDGVSEHFHNKSVSAHFTWVTNQHTVENMFLFE